MTGEAEPLAAVEGTWLLLRAGDKDYALDAGLVREVVSYPGDAEFLPVPRAAREIRGALVIRGQPVPALCLTSWLDGAIPARDRAAVLVVLEVPGLELGLAVEAVAGPGGLAMQGEEEPDREHFLLGSGILENWPVRVLNGEALVVRLREELCLPRNSEDESQGMG